MEAHTPRPSFPPEKELILSLTIKFIVASNLAPPLRPSSHCRPRATTDRTDSFLERLHKNEFYQSEGAETLLERVQGKEGGVILGWFLLAVFFRARIVVHDTGCAFFGFRGLCSVARGERAIFALVI